MIGRYKMYRGARPAHDPLPDGLRQDTRKHTRHVLRPEAGMVRDYLSQPGAAAWERFRRAYLDLLAKRFTRERDAFDRLAALACDHDVFLGCSCPTKANPDVRHCHTVLALDFLKAHYPDLELMELGTE